LLYNAGGNLPRGGKKNYYLLLPELYWIWKDSEVGLIHEQVWNTKKKAQRRQYSCRDREDILDQKVGGRPRSTRAKEGEKHYQVKEIS